MLYERFPGLVSVVMTCHNVAPYVDDCLNSILNQTYKNIELIIVNDYSTDHTAEMIDNWIKKSNPSFPVVVVDLPRNVGFSGALNTGYYLSSGEYIAVQDGDDLSHPNRIEQQVNFLKMNPDHVLIGTNYKVFADGEFENQNNVHWLKYGQDIKEVYWNGGHCICHGTILFRGVIFDELGGPTRRIKGAEDYEFIAKCLNSNYQIENLKEALYYYRLHPMQRSREFFGEGSKEI
ncbi:glycosyltransferase family 2 protein [Peribacillus frigoritolerans]|uniref:glycosyltransferase family 2 protein n=1 Tax=Peribacillus frigoritolerans TaxID=450367 RepID=UPI0039A08997